jgi:hypothetical protein
MNASLSRRVLLQSTGALVVGLAAPRAAFAQASTLGEAPAASSILPSSMLSSRFIKMEA